MSKSLYVLVLIMFLVPIGQHCFAQSDNPYYNLGYSIGSEIKKKTDENKALIKKYDEEISSARRELDAENRKLDSLNRLISIAEKWVEYNKKTWILDRGTPISFYEIDCVPNIVFLTLKIVEVDYLVYALCIEDPSPNKHRLSCDNVVIRYKTVYGEDVYRKTMLNLELVYHNNINLLETLFDLPEDAIDERTLTISFTGTKIKKID